MLLCFRNHGPTTEELPSFYSEVVSLGRASQDGRGGSDRFRAWASPVSGPGPGATDPAAIRCILYTANMVHALRENVGALPGFGERPLSERHTSAFLPTLPKSAAQGHPEH